MNRDLLLIIKSTVLGDGETDLGEKLIQSFLGQLLDSGEIPAQIICLSSGVFLTTAEGTPGLETMKRFEKAGSKIFSCGTCLEYYDRRDKLQVGSIGNMADTVHGMLEFNKVLQL